MINFIINRTGLVAYTIRNPSTIEKFQACLNEKGVQVQVQDQESKEPWFYYDADAGQVVIVKLTMTCPER